MRKILALCAVLLLLSGHALSQSQCLAPPLTPLAASFFGFSISPGTLTSPGNFPSVGFGSMRVSGFNSQWSSIETSNGVYNWTNIDSWLSLANTQGKQVVLGVYFTPAWASSNPTGTCNAGAGTCYPPSDIASGDNFWKAFITALVNHSNASSTAKIHYYEMWNEIDGTGFWKGTSAQMVQMVTDAYAIIHALDPQAKVLTPSVSSFQCCSGQGYTALNAYFAAGGAATNAQDIVNIHSYPPGTPPIQPTQLPGEIAALRTLMSTYGIGNEPIWFTEDSWNGSAQTTMTSDQQVAWIGQKTLYDACGGVTSADWFQWDNATIGTMWTSGGGVNTAGTAAGLIYNWMVGSTYQPNACSMNASTSTWSMNLTLQNGNIAQIYWNNASTPTITVATTFTHYLTLDNNTVNNIVSNQVTLGIKPIMVTP